MMGEAQQIVGEYRVVELRKDCATKICIVVCNQQIWVGRTHKGGGGESAQPGVRRFYTVTIEPMLRLGAQCIG